jgi:hypothetical protein
VHAYKPNHVRVRVLDMNVMDIRQQNSINKDLRGLGEVGNFLSSSLLC